MTGHMSENVAEFLQKVAEEWHFTIKDVVLVTDNAHNMVVAGQEGKHFTLRKMLGPHAKSGS